MAALLKALRYAAFGVLALALAGLLAVGYLVMTFEPDDYRDDLIGLVEERTGRAFTIGGALELHLDPPLVGFEIHDVSFDNPPGFGQEPMLTAKRVEAYLRIAPLLMGDLEIHSVRLDGLQLRLRRKSSGLANWDGLLDGDVAGDRAEAEGDAGDATGIDLAEIRLSDATIAIWDEARDRRMRASNLSLRLERIGFGTSARAQLDGELMAWLDGEAESRINAQVQMSADLDLEGGGERISGEDLDVKLDLAGPAFAFASVSPAIQARSFQWDASRDFLRLDGADATVEGASLRFDRLEARSLSEKPELTGRAAGTGIDVLRWIELWGAQAPKLEDPTALRFLKWESDLKIHPNGVQLSGLDATLDATTIQGDFSLLDFDRPQIALDLRLGEIDLDRYLPRDQDSPTGVDGDAEAATDGLPVEWLRRQRIAAKLRLERLRWQGLDLTQASAQLTAERGIWEIDKLNGRAGDGALQAGAELDVSGGIPRYRLDLKVDQLDLDRALAPLGESGRAPLEGAADLNLALNARGRRLATAWPSLTGFVSLAARDGAVRIGGIARAVEAAVAALQERPSETTPGGALPFDLLRASWDANDGRLTSRELRMEAGSISLDGRGYIDLPRSRIDYQLTARVGESLRIPVRVKGPFDDLSHSLDMSTLAKERIDEELDEGARSLADEIEEKVEEKIGDTGAKAVRKLLEDLF